MTDSLDILNALPSAYLLFDDNGIIQLLNTALCDLLGYQSQELINRNVETVFSISSRIFYQTQLYPLIRLKGKVDEIFLTLRTKQGKSIPVMLYCHRRVLAEKLYYVCVFVTVWERQKHELANSKAKEVQQENEVLKNLKEELELQRQQLDRQVLMLIQRNHEYIELSKVFSHDLQEPIRKIGMFTDILQHSKGIEHYPEIAGYGQRIQKMVVRLQNLTESLQQFIYLDSINEITHSIEIDTVIEEAKKAAITAVNFDDFTIVTGAIPAFEGRSRQIGILFTELFKNAIQNRNPDTHLIIRIEGVVVEENSYQASREKYRYTEHLKLKISDNGKGFDNQYNSYVFGLFNKLNANSPGAGLGLALVRQVILYHFGTISASSEEGQGTLFTIILPVVQFQ